MATEVETNRGGRPALAPEHRRSEQIYYRLKPWERRALELVADCNGRTLSDQTRALLLPHLNEAVTEMEIAALVQKPETDEEG